VTSVDPTSQPLHTLPVVADRPPSSAERVLSEESDRTTRPQSRRASWIKRLSAISNSQPSSRDTSPGPLSPAVSCSNGSMAFSHDGSTVPMIGERPPPPLPPNKLVKRSSSVHASRDASAQPSGSRLPSFRRPATSHQRSATLQHQTALLEMTLENSSPGEQPPYPSTDSEVEYTPFFKPRVAREKTLTKRKGPMPNSRALKRIYPDVTHMPTLLLAKSVSAGVSTGAEEMEDSASEEGDSVYFVSRPATPLSITAVIATQSELSDRPGRQRSWPPLHDADEAARPRRSFSITDLLSSSSNAKKQRAGKLPGAKLVRRSSKTRASSVPLPAMEQRRSNTAHGDLGAATVRRDLTDPVLIRRQISTSAGLTHVRAPQHGTFGASSSSPLPEMPHQAGTRPDPGPGSMRPSDVNLSAFATSSQPPTVAQTGARPCRNSMAPSEQASTLVGSDNEARGVGTGDEDDADLQSETAFDSLRTGATRSTSGARGPRIETIFDESPPAKVKVTALRDLLPKGTFREQAFDAAPGQQSIAEEEESISTPVRTIVPDRSARNSPSLTRGSAAPLFPNLIPSSPPDMPKPLNLGTLEWDSRAEDDDSSSRWSVDDDDEDSWGDLPTRLPSTLITTPVSLPRHNSHLLGMGSSLKPFTAQHLNLDHGDRDARSSIFDWSEQQPADIKSGNRTPPRPSTVHGKKDADRRGSRAVGRRAPSGLHARSQSVPVVPDATGKRSTVVTNKFGTWGVGSKGVTEDWNDDFDFSDLHEDTNAEAQAQRVDSGVAMVVPNHIQAQQSNVLANIGLLREWGLLIEELKEQRVRAASLDILEGPHAGMWEEVDAMIDLADQEADGDGIPRLSPPSSPGFDDNIFDDVSGSSPKGGEIGKSGLASDMLGKNNSHPQPKFQPDRLRRKSILPPNHKIFGPQSSPVPPKSKYESPTISTDGKTVATRPRKDSEAKARSVIEALQKRRSTHESLVDNGSLPQSKKVPFDTATLRRIVPYVSTLTRQVKEALREAEGLCISPHASPSREAEPLFNNIFTADNDLPTQMKLMTVM